MSFQDEPDFDSDCAVHGVACWSIEEGHEVLDDAGEETGAWCNGPLELRDAGGTEKARLG